VETMTSTELLSCYIANATKELSDLQAISWTLNRQQLNNRIEELKDIINVGLTQLQTIKRN